MLRYVRKATSTCFFLIFLDIFKQLRGYFASFIEELFLTLQQEGDRRYAPMLTKQMFN